MNLADAFSASTAVTLTARTASEVSSTAARKLAIFCSLLSVERIDSTFTVDSLVRVSDMVSCTTNSRPYIKWRDASIEDAVSVLFDFSSAPHK